MCMSCMQMHALRVVGRQIPLLLRYYIGNLVVAALRRHEALGWLGLEVKRDSLRGNFVAASTRTRRARRWGWCQDGCVGVVARGADLLRLLRLRLRVLGLLLLGLHLLGLLLQGLQLPRCTNAGQASHVGSASALHAHEPCMCTAARVCTVYSAFAALFTVLICYSSRITALRKLRFGGTVLLAPHDSTASKAGSDLTAASSCEDCGVMFRWG